MVLAPERAMSASKKSFEKPVPGEEIYITGVAGAYPDSRSVHELQENLFNKVDLVSDDYRRWKGYDIDVPQRTGKIYDLEKFDASFFNIDHVRANVLDPSARIMYEKVYEAIIDAGYNPSELRKHKVGVFLGAVFSEAETTSCYSKQDLHEYGTVSCSRAAFANNISQWLGVSGVSYVSDTACSSSAYALEHAFKAVKEGRCDVAIAGGMHLCLSDMVSQKFFQLGVLSKDGRCKCFDEKADGYARSETVAIVLMQRAKHARRVYAEVIHAKTNCDGYKERGITYPAGNIQKELLERFYQECGVQPTELEFVEAHGTGTRVGDPEELKAIDEVFCKGRPSPLMIGSIKSNLGHTETCSGVCSLTKLVIAYHSGYIPPNINFSKYREGIPGFQEGRMVVVTEKQPWSRGLAACSSFGFGGANAHMLLRNVARDKINNGLPSDELPRLVCVSGRTRSAVAKVLDHLHSKTVDVDEVRLWHAVHEHDIPGHHFRGYILLGSLPTKSIELARDVRHTKNTARPVWLLYPGLGAQWPGMASSLMKLPVFADAVQKCQNALDGVDLMELLIRASPTAFDNVLHSVVATTAVQIGLSDVLKTVSVHPDNIIGHSIGQLGCAYMRGVLTAKQTIQAAYYIGLALDKTGCLANPMASMLLKKLEQVIPSSELRMELVHVLQKPGSLKNVADNIQSDAVVVEVTPSAQLKDKFQFTKVSLGQENKDGLHVLLVALGKLFQESLNPALANLYPHVQFPVAQGTSYLSHLIEWNHKETWSTELILTAKYRLQEDSVNVNLSRNDDQHYLAGHIIDGRTLYPATGYLEMAWKTLARMHGQAHTDMSVVFENVSLNRATTIPENGSLDFIVSIHKGTGDFQILEGDTPVVTGRIYEKKNVGADYRDIPDAPATVDEKGSKVTLTSKDFYKELNLRGYQYKGRFRGVVDCDVKGTTGHIVWWGNWVPFLDALLQPLIISHDTRALYVPTRIEKFSIDVDIHSELLKKNTNHLKVFRFQSFPHCQVTRIGGVELRGLHVTAIAKKPALGIPVYEKNEFIPNYMHSKMEMKDIVRSDFQLIFENVRTYKFKVIELVDEEYQKNKITPIVEDIDDVLSDLPLVQAELLILSKSKISELPSHVTILNKNISTESNVVVFVGANLLHRPEVLSEAMGTLKDGCFVMSREETCPNPMDNLQADYDITTIHNTGSHYIVLLRKQPKPRRAKFFELSSSDETFSWVERLKEKMKDNSQKLVVYSKNEDVNGLLGLVNCLRREPGGESVYGLLIADPKAPAFNPDSEFIQHQLSKNLAINVYKNGVWGTYRHLLLAEPAPASAPHAYVNVTTVGDLSSLRWFQGPFKPNQTFKQNNFKLLHVYCSALNFRDVMTASGRVTLDAVARGRLAQECVQGLEVSGRTLNGSRVMAVCDRGICNLARCEESLMWCIPDEWTFEEAATVPVAYATVYMALVLIGNIKRGESILIHAGSGGVGQAAISVALHHGLEVFTTVGTPAKREFVKRLFPQLQDSHIGNSRDTSFEDMIRRETNGKGVHVVLNSLADDKLQASVKCLTRRGRFLEIGKYDITINTLIETYLFNNEISFHGVMLDFISDAQSHSLRKNLQKLLMVGITSGAVRPLTSCIFSKDEIVPAYRYMAAGKHIGKVIVKIRNEEARSDTTIKPVAAPITAIPRYTCDEDRVYVLLGGLGGFGLELADWLVLRGARKLVLCSRRGVSNGYQALRIRIWESYGTEVQISTDDITTETGCEAILKRAKEMGPVVAVFNLAVVLRDAVFQNQTEETFKESYGPKALATIHLDKLTRKLCPDLKDFVIFSSVSCGRGNAGQTNYGFSNSVMERICEIRKNEGLPALAIQWGAIGDVGLVADMQEDNIQLEIGGTLQQRVVSCFQAMDTFLMQDAAVVSSIVVAEKKLGGANSGSCVDAVATILGIKDLKTVSHQTSLAELGMDSIMAVEVKQTLERDYEIFLSAQEIRTLSLSKLIDYNNKKGSDEASTPNTKEQTNVNKSGSISLIIKNLGDEKHASNSLIRCPTLVSNNNKVDAETLFMMAGIENCASALITLCSRLESHACVLQLGVEHNDEDLGKMVDRMYQIIKSQLAPGQRFHLLGYSFGTIVILKLAAKLEEDGYKGNVICVDGAPEFLYKLAKGVVGDSQPDSPVFQKSYLQKIASFIYPNNELQSVIDGIKKNESFEKMIDAFLALPAVQDDEAYSKEYKAAIMLAMYNRIKVILDAYKQMDVRLKAPITLIRSKSLPFNLECSEDYGLSGLCEHPVVVHYLDETHMDIVDSEECAAIVNQAVGGARASEDSDKTRTGDL